MSKYELVVVINEDENGEQQENGTAVRYTENPLKDVVIVPYGIEMDHETCQYYVSYDLLENPNNAKQEDIEEAVLALIEEMLSEEPS